MFQNKPHDECYEASFKKLYTCRGNLKKLPRSKTFLGQKALIKKTYFLILFSTEAFAIFF
jgi:hypothetical protein